MKNFDFVKAFADSPCIKFPYQGELYNEILSPYEDKEIRFFEIGIFQGYSLVVWNQGLPKAKLFGMDFQFPDTDLSFCEKLFHGNQAYRPYMLKVAEELKELDVCIDDGGHFADEQQVSFECLWPIIKSGGIYVVEDLHQAANKTVDGFSNSVDYFEKLDIKKKWFVGMNGFEKDTCVLYKE